VAPSGNIPSLEVAEEATIVNRETIVKSKILSHFIKGKIALSPMEIVLMIPGELEHLKNLVKLACRKKDANTVNDQVSVVLPVSAIRRICVNKTSRSKTLHLPMEIHRYIVEGLVDTGASMSVMAAAVVREMGMMHLVVGSETYKTASRVVTQALGRIDEVSVGVGSVHCTMTFMVVDTDSYDVLLGLDFLMKIGAIVDVERGLIQVRKGLRANMEVLPLTMVNLLQNVNSEALEHDAAVASKSASFETLEVDLGKMSLYDSVVNEQVNVLKSESDTDADDDGEEGFQSAEPINEESEFGNTELEELVLKEGPQQILQLTLQDQADDFMREEISESDDYVDWIQWVSDAEKGKPINRESTLCAEVPVLLQIHQVSRKEAHPKQLASSVNCPEVNTRWEEISQKIRIDHNLGEEKKEQLWRMIGKYQDVFVWNKGELGCCIIGEHSIDTQGLPPCKTSPARLSYWEETEVKMQIDVLVDLGKMRPNNSEYACRVTLLAKKDGSRCLCGDYRPLNAQTRQDMFPMPFVEDVIDQLGKSTWFTAFDLQSGFWQIRMALEDVKKTALITKTGLYDWTVMPFGLKNATSTFTRTMAEVFKDLGSAFLKVFVDNLNVHSETWGEHIQHLDAVLYKLREVNLKLNPSKCCFAAKTITFLGHMVS
jgi:predicted aspartyl protease